MQTGAPGNYDFMIDGITVYIDKPTPCIGFNEEDISGRVRRLDPPVHFVRYRADNEEGT
jgi:hypothetical protein